MEIENVAVENTQEETGQNEATQASPKPELVKSQTNNPETTQAVKKVQPKMDWEKQYKELQSSRGKEQNELGELRKFFQQYNADYQKRMQMQRQQEMQQRYQQDPYAGVQDIIKQQIQPIEQRLEEQANMEHAHKVDQYYRESFGTEYEAIQPLISEIIARVSEADSANGTQNAKMLIKQYPNELALMAKGLKYDADKASRTQAAQQTQSNKTKSLNNMSGIAKNNKTAPTVSSNSFDGKSLLEMQQMLRSKGIFKQTGE